MKTIFHKILATTALCLAAGACLTGTNKVLGNDCCSSTSARMLAVQPGCIRVDAATRVSVPIVETKNWVANLEKELHIKLIRLQALSEQHNKNGCCWEMVFCDAQGRTLILQVASSGVVYGDKSHREIWPSDIQQEHMEYYSRREEIPWDSINSLELQHNERVAMLYWREGTWICLLNNQRGRFYLHETQSGIEIRFNHTVHGNL